MIVAAQHSNDDGENRNEDTSAIIIWVWCAHDASIASEAWKAMARGDGRTMMICNFFAAKFNQSNDNFFYEHANKCTLATLEFVKCKHWTLVLARLTPFQVGYVC
jgi:hypothetical protein